MSFSLSFSFNVQVNSRLEGDWSTINEDETYTVLAGSFIASGKDGYIRMGEIADKIDLFKVDSETFISYCQEKAVLSEPSADEYATQRFIAAGATRGESTDTSDPSEGEAVDSFEAESGAEAENTDAEAEAETTDAPFAEVGAESTPPMSPSNIVSACLSLFNLILLSNVFINVF